MDSRIYVCTHKMFNPPGNELYHPLHVGAACHDILPYEGDDSGDSISGKNRSYAELTGQYWVWKNVTCDIVGMCHYRRYFIYKGHFINSEDIEAVFPEYDAILPYSTIIGKNPETNKLNSTSEHYVTRHNTEILPMVREVISQRCPEYLNSYDITMNACCTHFYNMLICKKEIFDAYSEWLFDIFTELESRIDIDDYTGDQSRVFGFLGERLLTVWFLHSNLRILELKVQQTDIDPAVEKENKNESIRSILKRLFHDLIQIYNMDKDTDLVPVTPVAELREDRIPVFVCWWQGEETAPEIIRMCINSIRKNFSGDSYDLHLISWENHQDYVIFPSWIYEKYEAGAITRTHLSDILRFYLLYSYGGVWIDASYLITKRVDASEFCDRDFYTIRGAIDEADGKAIDWSGNFWKMKAGNRLARFGLNAFYLYWATQDVMIDYFLIDHVIRIAYEEFADIRQMLDDVEISQTQVLEMAKILHRRFDNSEYEEMTKDTGYFKLSYKGDVWKQDIFGRQTFYGYLCDKYLEG